MKIALLSTHPGLIENKRIREVVEDLKYEFQFVDLTNFGYEITDNKLNVPGITDLVADVAIVRGIFLSLKPISEAVDELRKRGTKVFDNSLLTHQYSINKITDILKLSKAGIPTPDTYYHRSFDGYTKAAQRIGYPVIVKLTRAGKGAGIYKMNDKQELEEFIVRMSEQGYVGSSYIMQEFFDYEHDLRMLVIGGRIYSMKRTPREGDFRANFSLGGSVELFKPDEETQQLALDALKAIDMTVGGVDVLIRKDGKKVVLEVNHTAGFVGMEKATGENITKKYVEHAIEKAA